MDIEHYRDYCLAKPRTSEGFPFDTKVLVFKVMGMMFALTDVDAFESINLKCDPDLAVRLREEYDGLVLPGYHMNKHHWNTILMNAGIGDRYIKEWIDHSYELIVESLPKKLKEELKNL